MVGFSDISPSDFQLENWLTQSGKAPPLGSQFIGLDSIAQGLVILKRHESAVEPVFVVFSSSAAARDAIDHFSFFGGKEVAD